MPEPGAARNPPELQSTSQDGVSIPWLLKPLVPFVAQCPKVSQRLACSRAVGRPERLLHPQQPQVCPREQFHTSPLPSGPLNSGPSRSPDSKSFSRVASPVLHLPFSWLSNCPPVNLPCHPPAYPPSRHHPSLLEPGSAQGAVISFCLASRSPQRPALFPCYVCLHPVPRTCFVTSVCLVINTSSSDQHAVSATWLRLFALAEKVCEHGMQFQVNLSRQ